MRAETRRRLKEDRFSLATIGAAEATVHWSEEHQTRLIVGGLILAVVLAIGFGGWYYLNQQDLKASALLNQAVRTMDTQLRPAGTPAQAEFPSFASGNAVVPSPHPRSKTLSPFVIPSDLTSASPLSLMLSAMRVKSPFSQSALFGFTVAPS